MKKNLKRILLLFYLFGLLYFAKGQTPVNDKNWSDILILEDQFNGTAGSLPNPSIWNPHRGFNDYVKGEEIGFTFWPSGNVYLDGASHLILKTEYVPTDPEGIYLHSGAINSKSMSYGYGYYEIRCKLNSYSIHFLPAFWVWGGGNCECSDDPNAPGCDNGWYNENDFFETICEPNHFDVTNNVHNWAGNCTNNWGHTSHFFVNNNDLFNNFHTYGYEWTPGRIIYYLDGKRYKYFESPYVANNPLFLCVTLGWNGKLDENFYSELSSLPLESRQMTIDYIKVFNLKRDCANPGIIENQTHLNNFNYAVKRNIRIGTPSSNISVPANEELTFRMVEDLIIQGNFTVPLGSEMNVLQTTCY